MGDVAVQTKITYKEKNSYGFMPFSIINFVSYHCIGRFLILFYYNKKENFSAKHEFVFLNPSLVIFFVFIFADFKRKGSSNIRGMYKIAIDTKEYLL